MHPLIFSIGSVHVFAYGTFFALAYFLGYVYNVWRGAGRGVDEETVIDIYLILIVAGVFGARVNYILSDPEPYLAAPIKMFKVWEGGLVFLGGVIGALGGSLIYLKVRKLSIPDMLDLWAPSLALGAAVGRIGCFLNGCCYGITTTCALGMVFPGIEPKGVPRHPTQLYEIVVLALMFVLFDRMLFWKLRPGMVMVWFGYLYSIERFAVEFIREESVHEHYIFGYTLAQSTCMFLALGAALGHLAIVRRSRRARTAP